MFFVIFHLFTAVCFVTSLNKFNFILHPPDLPANKSITLLLLKMPRYCSPVNVLFFICDATENRAVCLDSRANQKRVRVEPKLC